MRSTQRAKAEQELAEQRAQDEALQAYLDQMSQLMLDRKLLEAEQGTPLYTLAQARTSTLILRLDAEHNESVTRFLINSGLALSSESTATRSTAGLLSGIALPDATLRGAFLGYADLSVATLAEANLSRADLYDANLTKADLGETNLSDAYLGLANLSGAHVGYNSDGSPRLVANEKLEEQARPSKVLPCPTARSTRTGSLARCLRNNYLMPALFSSMLDKEKAVKEENGHRR